MPQARLVTVSTVALLSLLAACATGPAQVADTPESRSSAAAALAQLEIDDGGLDKVLDDGAEAGLSYAAEPLSEDLGRERRRRVIVQIYRDVCFGFVQCP